MINPVDILAWRMRWLICGFKADREEIEKKVLSCYNPFNHTYDIHLEDGSMFRLKREEIQEFINDAVIRQGGILHRYSLWKKQR